MGYEVYVTDGTPIDAIHLAVEVLNFQPDLVISGVNVGENLSLQHIFYSGTVGVAIEAALRGINAVAVSANVGDFSAFDDPKLRDIVSKLLRALVNEVKSRGFPRGVDVFNINIPKPSEFRGCIKVVKAAKLRWWASYKRDRDPRNRVCYWLTPRKKLAEEEDTDVVAVDVSKCVALTPLSIDLNVGRESLEGLKEWVKPLTTIY